MSPKDQEDDKTTEEGWREMFMQFVNELCTSNEYTEEPVYFGFRRVLRDEHGNDNIVTATDWGHVESFFAKEIKAAEERGEKREREMLAQRGKHPDVCSCGLTFMEHRARGI